jgi:hypothetical protein
MVQPEALSFSADLSVMLFVSGLSAANSGFTVISSIAAVL